MQEDKVIRVHVGKELVEVKQSENPILASVLKERGNIPAEGYDLWLRVPGPGQDKRFEDNEKVEVKEGDHFYGMKSVMTPGA